MRPDRPNVSSFDDRSSARLFGSRSFFILSGFVLAYAFAEKFEAGLTFFTFLGARVRRLFPVVLIGTVLCASGEFVFVHRSLLALTSDAVLGSLLLPVGFGSGAFPINGPMWSLFLEFWVNVAFGLFAFRFRISTLLAITIAGYGAMVGMAMHYGTVDFGAMQGGIFAGFLRAFPAFALGMLIFRLWRARALDLLPSVDPVLIFAVWIIFSIIPTEGSITALYDIVGIVLLAPLLIALLARTERVTPVWALWLGRISYPLYGTHWFFVRSVWGYSIQHHHVVGWLLLSMAIPALATAEIVTRWIEPALRKVVSIVIGAVLPPHKTVPPKGGDRWPPNARSAGP